MSNEPQIHCASSSALRIFFAWVVGVGTCLVLLMATLAFGPSGFGFGLVIAIVVFILMVRRYRFSLRTFLIATTVFGIWLGLKVRHDMSLQRAITGITSAGGQLKVHDRRPNFPWGIWAERFDLGFYKLSQPLSDEQFAHLQILGPSSLWWLNLENTGIGDDRMGFVGRLRGLEYLALANSTYRSGQRIPGRPQNQITDGGLAKLTRLKTLRGIDVSGTDVTDECLMYLLQMPQLRWIYLTGTKVTGAGMGRLATLNDLAMVELNGCPISPDGFRQLSQLTNVMSLGLHNTGMTDKDLDVLNVLSQVDIMRLGGNNVSNEAIERFAEGHPRCTIER